MGDECTVAVITTVVDIVAVAVAAIAADIVFAVVGFDTKTVGQPDAWEPTGMHATWETP